MSKLKQTQEDYEEARNYRKILINYFNNLNDENRWENDSNEEELNPAIETIDITTPPKKQSARKSTTNEFIECPECKKLVKKSAINMHNSIHKYEKMGRFFRCSLCSYRHRLKSYVIRHIKTSHSIEHEQPEVHEIYLIQRPGKNLKVERVKCDKCKKLFALKFLNRHRLSCEGKKRRHSM